MEPRETDEVREMQRKWIREQALDDIRNRTTAITALAGVIFGLGVHHILFMLLPKEKATVAYLCLLLLLWAIAISVGVKQYRRFRRFSKRMNEDRAEFITKTRERLDVLLPNDPEQIRQIMQHYEKTWPLL